MRVITGTARGMKLQTLDGLATRPTTDKVKEAIFSILQFELEGRKVLDLFAGSGQLGIEALSRGARHAVFVEQSAAAARVIQANLKHTKLQENATVRTMSVSDFLKTCRERFDVILMDPPYQENQLESTLNRISEIDILSEGGIIVCERPDSLSLPAEIGRFTKAKDYRYGKTGVTVYRCGT